MRKVAHILARKRNKVQTVPPSTSVIDALKIMADKGFGSVVVMEDDKFLGIMTERDYSRKVILKGKSSTDTTVGEIMSSNFPEITPNDTVDHCMHLLTENVLRYLPVIKNGELLGIVSMSDVVAETILTHEETISHLQSYIHS